MAQVAAAMRDESWMPSVRWQNTLSVAAKRAFDVAATATVLLLLAPVVLVVAALVRLSSPGPILFRQQRIGKDGQPFAMLKFRTMYVNCDPEIHKAYVAALLRGEAEANGGVYKLTHDPRITPVGRTLRRFSLDELPQLVNVLRGEMSLVGPRPPLPYEVEMYDQRAWRRLSVVPGLTGLWQVSGRNKLTFHQMIDLDLTYIASWSLWLDLLIVLRTPLVLVTGRGAC